MTYYTCEPDFESMLSCIYEAFAGRRGQKNIRLCLEPVEQLTLFDEYIHVDRDAAKADRLYESMCLKISPAFAREMAYTAMAYEEDALDNMYRCMLLGFAFGPNVLKMVQYRDIMRNEGIRVRLGKEVNRFQEFSRFHLIGEDVYIAHIEPKSRLVEALGPIFEDRMPSEHFVIVDDVHREAVVHPRDERFYVRKLNEAEYRRLLQTEEVNDEMTDLWKLYFRTTAVEQRINPACQMNHFPKWTRKHAVEFMD